MAPFAPTLDHAQASAIRDYVIHRANAPDGPNAGKSVRQPDLNHGAAIVAQGTAAGAPACAQCHAFHRFVGRQRRFSRGSRDSRPLGLPLRLEDC